MNSEDYKSAISNVFSEIAASYDSNLFFDISAKNLIDLAGVDKFKTMLDVTTGTGVVALSCAQQNPNLKIDAVDLAEGMLEKGREKAKLLGISNISFLNKDIEKLDYESESFDLITCGYGLFFFPDLIETYKNLYDLLKPGGRMVFSSFTGEAFQPFTNILVEDLKEYGFEPKEIAPLRLNTIEQINSLNKQAAVKNYDITFREIRYRINTNGWWALINSAGYKGMVDQVKAEYLAEFKKNHLERIEKLNKGLGLLLVADSFYTVVEK